MIVMTGKDAAGTSHEVELSIQADTTNIGSTTVQSIDITGKTVTESNFSPFAS